MKSASSLPGASELAPVLPTTAPATDTAALALQMSAVGHLFPIVGIGTSAGGLEALEQFLKHVPNASGMAFVIVQHLDPSHKGMLPEILRRATSMTVHQVKNRMKVQPNCVYVIPPNKDMSIKQGVLYLHVPQAPRGLRLPIDFFFNSLARDRHQFGIGVILSGMGADGTQGLRAIKLQGGLVAAQEPSSAKFDSMPRAAIAAQVTDLVAPPAILPEKIIDFLRQGKIAVSLEPEPEAHYGSALEDIVMHLHARTGRDFSFYKKSSLYRRIERRMSVHQISHIANYARYVQHNPQELDLLFKELLIGVTSFFRDPLIWDHLKEKEFPAIFAANPKGKKIRAWVSACSTGEEAYSLAITFMEALEQAKPSGRFTLEIFATDLDADAIERARRGIYPAGISANVTPLRLQQFFIKEGNSYRIRKAIREMVTFAPQDIILDPPFTKLDILCCRNLLIYFGAELHKKLMPMFHYALNPNGILVLGSAETIGNFSNLFTALDSKVRIYRRLHPGMRQAMVEFLAGSFSTLPNPPEKTKMHIPTANLQSLADQILLQQFSPAAVLVNGKGDILYINGRTGKYLEPAAGKANWNIHAMAREELRGALASALYEAARNTGKASAHGIQMGEGNDIHIVDINVKALDEPSALHGMFMVAFTERPAPPIRTASSDTSAPSTANLADLKEALEQAHKENQNIREEMQAAREELRSANEELQSNNEELQSTNEELTSSREEMQSMNEELQTINAELQSKVEDLSRTSNDMKNLLDSTDIATVFLDNDLNVRRFTNRTTQIFKLIPSDVGRPLSDIVSDLQYPGLQDDARQVLESLVFTDKQIPTRDQRWFKVRIMPYRTQENLIDGVVITFTDITTAKQLEAELRQEIQSTEK